MIKAVDLMEARPTVKYQDVEEVSLEKIKEILEECANKKGIEISFKKEQVVSGKSKRDEIEDCLVVYHPKHEKDYFKICIRIKKQGIYTFVSIHQFGKSNLNTKSRMVNGAAMGAVVGGLSGGLLGGVVGLAAGNVLKKKLSPNQIKLEEENMYYECLMDIIDEVIS